MQSPQLRANAVLYARYPVHRQNSIRTENRAILIGDNVKP